ncbi:spindle and kinetochore-associated protein 2 isoform 2-T2 [Porphyrio hochstetteri]
MLLEESRNNQAFQQAESDLDYIQHRLEFEIRKSLPDNASPEENPLAVLEALSMLKSRYKKLRMRMEKVSQEQRECMKGIRIALGETMRIICTIQQQAHLKREPLSEEECDAAELIMYRTPQELEALSEEVVRQQCVNIPETIKPE